ncbi:MAG: hypothetical protein FWG66_13885 [Spirochaetes bacterium]|nr:hypothetical protein [Spirochaetota bacterium]
MTRKMKIAVPAFALAFVLALASCSNGIDPIPYGEPNPWQASFPWSGFITATILNNIDEGSWSTNNWVHHSNQREFDSFVQAFLTAERMEQTTTIVNGLPVVTRTFVRGYADQTGSGTVDVPVPGFNTAWFPAGFTPPTHTFNFVEGAATVDRMGWRIEYTWTGGMHDNGRDQGDPQFQGRIVLPGTIRFSTFSRLPAD